MEDVRKYSSGHLVIVVCVALLLGILSGHIITKIANEHSITEFNNLAEKGAKYKRLEKQIIAVQEEGQERLIPVINFPVDKVNVGQSFIKSNNLPFTESVGLAKPAEVKKADMPSNHTKKDPSKKKSKKARQTRGG